MANKKDFELIQIFGRRLIVGGLVLILVGILRLYNVEWPIILIVIGVVLLVKGLLIKTKRKLI
ncbi:MAG: hypothetical protein QW818_03540 [Candidatus Aenigmatarchaeota archaeon]|nr:hypothetical protein [Candidatus Aenigmarchaeota archaeon]